MSINVTSYNNTIYQKHCVNCGKIDDVSICNGCQLTFCNKHMIKHRKELAYQLENVIQEYNLLQQNIKKPSNEYFYLQKIDSWERESIKKIRITAENARKDLQIIKNRSRKRLINISRETGVDLNSLCRKGDYSEKDLIRLMNQLNEIRFELKSSYSIELSEDKRSPIYPIVMADYFLRNDYVYHQNVSNSLDPHSREQFFKATSPASIENGGMIVKHIGPDLHYAYVLGKKIYSRGRHTTRFKILQCTLPYVIFFGCISSESFYNELHYKSSLVVGWFGYNEIYQHGIWDNNSNNHGYNSDEIQRNDVLYLTFNCDQHQIELFHERTSKRHKLSVSTDKAPLPWQILVILVHEDDCLKILPSA